MEVIVTGCRLAATNRAVNQVTPDLLHTQAADLIRDAITLREATTGIDVALTEAQAQPGLHVATVSTETHIAFTDNLLLSRGLRAGRPRPHCGNLNGLPPETRDQASRLAIAAALATARADGASDTRVETYKRLLALDAGHTILAFSPEQNGRVAIAVGDITTASNVGVIVPGMDTTIDKYGGYLGSAEELMLTIEVQFNPGRT